MRGFRQREIELSTGINIDYEHQTSLGPNMVYEGLYRAIAVKSEKTFSVKVLTRSRLSVTAFVYFV